MSRQLTAASTLDNLKKEAKRWLKALRADDERAWARLRRAYAQAPVQPTLRDIQHALALEHGVEGWTALTKKLADQLPAREFTDLIKPHEFDSERPYGRWFSRGCDVWDAINAARGGDVPALRRLLACDPNLARYPQPIHFAAREGHMEAMQVLLDAGADPDVSGVSGENLITIARDRGHEQAAELLERVRGRTGRTTPAETTIADHAIHAAADSNDFGAVRRMLDAEPLLVHRGDRKGGTPLHRAVAASAHDVIGLLLDRGADIDALHGAGPGDASGYAAVDFQPIDLALFWHDRSDVDTARLLLRRGATYDLSIAAALGDLAHVTAQLDEDPRRIHEARPWGKRPLSAAVEFGHDAIARLLLDRGADPNWPEGADAPRGFALHSAARLGNHATVELLLEHGAIPTPTSIHQEAPHGRPRHRNCGGSCSHVVASSTAMTWSGSAKTMKSCVG